MQRKVLITSIWSVESIVKAITSFSVDRLFLLVNEDRNKTQAAAIEQIKKNYGKILEIKEKKIPVFDVVKIAERTVSLLDDLSRDEEVIINITPARKTQALGILFGAYKRAGAVSKVVYFNEEDQSLITLPLLSFDLTETQQRILEEIEKTKVSTLMAEKTEQSRAMLYRNIKELKLKGLIEDTPEGTKITDAGRIARL